MALDGPLILVLIKNKTDKVVWGQVGHLPPVMGETDISKLWGCKRTSEPCIPWETVART